MRIQVRSMLFVLALTTNLALQGACSKDEPVPEATPPAAQVADRETKGKGVAPQEKPVEQVTVTPIPIPIPTPEAKVVEAKPAKQSKPQPTIIVQKPGITITAIKMDPATAVEHLVAEGWNKIRSISAKITSTYDRPTDEGKRHHDGSGTSDFVRNGAHVRTVSRVGTYMKYDTGADPPIMLEGQKLTRYSEGKYMYTITERRRGTVVTKRFANHMQIRYLGGEKMFAFIRGLKNISELPAETIDGKYAFILEGELPRYHMKFRHYIDGNTGILLKMVVENSAKQSTSVTEFTDIEINIEFPEGHFVFKPPAGVEVQDLTIPGAELKPPTPHKTDETVEPIEEKP